jgi:hypothetical protein
VAFHPEREMLPTGVLLDPLVDNFLIWARALLMIRFWLSEVLWKT